jgi:hypothetical protein
VSYRQFPLWLNPAELDELIGEIGSAVMSKLHNEPAPDRSPYVLSTILFPTEDLPRHGTEEQSDHRQ